MQAQRENIDSGLFPIGTVAELTGVNPITLRAWERRYGLWKPIRKSSGHRLYTQQHIDLVNRVVALLGHGVRIGQVRGHLEAERRRSKAQAEGAGGHWKRYIDRMLAGIVTFDEIALEQAYGEALAIYPVQTVTDQLLTPLLEEVGRRWEDGEGSVAEEHFLGCYLRSKIGARFHHRARVLEGPRLLLACLPGERHENGLLLFALAAHDAGYRTVLLGADTPLIEIPAAAAKSQCDAVVLSGLLTPARAVIAALQQIVAACDAPLFVGGRASIVSYDSLKRAGAEPLGTDVQAGLVRIDEALAATV